MVGFIDYKLLLVCLKEIQFLVIEIRKCSEQRLHLIKKDSERRTTNFLIIIIIIYLSYLSAYSKVLKVNSLLGLLRELESA